MNTTPLRKTHGFTLIEILIATVIITIVSLGAASLTVGVIRGNSISKRLTTATTLMQDQLEDIKRLGYTNVGVSRTQNYGTIKDFNGTFVDFSGYKRVVTVTPDNPAAKMKTVKATIFWDADNRRMDATTILSE